MLQIGNKPIDTMYVGGKLVQQVYKGSKKVYPEHGVIPKAIKDSMVLWYDLKRQGATNESMAADPTIRDLSGNGHDATCYNFAWAGNSGIGGVAEDYISEHYVNFLNGRRGRGTVTHNTIHITEVLSNSVNIRFFETQNPPQNIKSYKIKVSGIEQGKSLLYSASNIDGQSDTTFVTIEQDGEYELPEVDITKYNNIGFRTVDWYGTCNITIEQLPQYPHALVYDGVDDSVRSIYGINHVFNDYTVIVKCINKPQIGKPLSYGDICNLSGTIANGNTRAVFGVLEYNGENNSLYAYSMGYSNTFAKPEGIYDEVVIVYQVKNSFNGIYGLNAGNDAITVTDKDYLNVGRHVGSVGRNQTYNGALYSLLLFDRTLTSDEINWVKTNLIESEQ